MKEKYLYKCFFAVFLCFVADSVISYFVPYNHLKLSMTIVPYLGLMLFSLLVKTIDVPERYFFGAMCGIYYSVVYSHSLVIYILIYALIAFIRSYIVKMDEFSFVESLLFVLSTIILSEAVVYWLMWITNSTHYLILDFVLYRLIPTLCFNLILSVFVYWIFINIKIEVK